MNLEQAERKQPPSVDLHGEIENFMSSVVSLEAELASHIRGLDLMSHQLNKIIDSLTGCSAQTAQCNDDSKDDESPQHPKYSMEGFEKRVQEVMAEINKDAIALRYLREEAMQIRENCLA
ncbi:Hypothetical protein GSB_150279 [Giardia duodenalis]|uniref:Uncharacterized protein n=1 Tax=Giardia intestinalis TaxID=5741 RepID=V6U3W7_GIAIN|nr:Hypothetical protein GSB_150279 [Giardia intestinalis]